jgi:hypothetical protein
MNVFACHADPAVSATWLADQHVVKMVTETAQILSTALVANGRQIAGLYKPTHAHHPCVLAAQVDPACFGWTALHGLALGAEYTVRFGKLHGALGVIQAALDVAGLDPAGVFQPSAFPLAMPDMCKRLDPHDAYCEYLRVKYAEWRERGGRVAPRWQRIVLGNPFVQT